MSELIVQIDEVTDAKSGVQVADANQLLEQTRTLLTPDENGQGFARRYFDALERDPGVAANHAATLKLLRGDISG
jgi:hypothetical protein